LELGSHGRGRQLPDVAPLHRQTVVGKGLVHQGCVELRRRASGATHILDSATYRLAHTQRWRAVCRSRRRGRRAAINRANAATPIRVGTDV
jgi:hypothetical protein